MSQPHKSDNCCHDDDHHAEVAGAEVAHASTSGVATPATRFRVPALCCDAEANLIRKRLGGLDGIDDVAINLVGRQIRVAHRDGVSSNDIVAALSEVGLSAEPLTAAVNRTFRPTRFPLPLAATGALLLVSLFSLAVEPLRWAALGAVAIGVWPILRRAVGAVRARSLDMHALMSVAVIGAIALGEWVEGAAVVFLFALSLWLEDRSLDRARRALQQVADLVPQTAVLADGRSIAIAEVTVGTRLALKSGLRVPVDGVVVQGQGSVDESALTGESRPVAKRLGDAVSAGTTLQDGYLEMSATATSDESAVARLVSLVDEAQAARSPTERFVDRFARIYTPLVLLGAALVAIVPPLLTGAAVGEWVYRALVLLVVACPCALVIATPVAVVSAMARAARRGVLIKGGVHLESLGRLSTLALDKTGTLTEGRFRVAECLPINGYSEDDLHELVATAQRTSSHPLAAALLEHTGPVAADGEQQLAYDAIEGEGIEVQDGDRRIQMGNHRMAERLGWHAPDEHAIYEEWASLGSTVLYTGVDGELAGLHALRDAPRPEAKGAVAELSGLGLELIMLTGDNAETAAAVGRQVGLSNLRSDLLPADKVEAVRALRSDNAAVGMVGDGINDAPALALADVGIAMGVRGTAVAMETADVALMSDDLSRLPEVIGLGRRALRVIRRNIVFALIVKAVVLLLAVIGVANLWMAVGADVGATLAVVLYSLTLLR